MRFGGDLPGLIDAQSVEAATGWRVVSRAEVASTSDLAAALRDAGVRRVVIVADRQTAGRGRGGARFESPEGGLYASLVVEVPSERLPGGLVAAVGVALAEAVEEVAGVETRLKWPNDLLVADRKAGGILVEAQAQVPGVIVAAVVGIGVNLARVPPGLPAEAEATALDLHARRPVRREALLCALLPRVSALAEALSDAEGAGEVERAWRERLAWRGEKVRCLVAGGVRRGVLVDASLEHGLALAPDGTHAAWVPMAYVREVRRDRA